MVLVGSAPTDHYLGVCQPCHRPIRRTIEQTDHYAFEPCPDCEQPVRLERLYATLTHEPCNPLCMGATGPSCQCGCGGANHAGAFSTNEGEMLHSALEAYRNRIAKQDADRAARVERDRKARQGVFDEWAADHQDVLAYLDTTTDRSWSEFIGSVQDQVDARRILSDRQVIAVRKAMARAVERAQRQQRVQAAATHRAPTGPTVVTGEIIAVRQRDGYHGRLVHKLRVLADAGYQLWVTMPRSLGPRQFNNTEWRAFLISLRGKRIQFTVDLTPSPGDPTFAYGKNARKATLLPTNPSEGVSQP